MSTRDVAWIAHHEDGTLIHFSCYKGWTVDVVATVTDLRHTKLWPEVDDLPAQDFSQMDRPTLERHAQWLAKQLTRSFSYHLQKDYQEVKP